MVLVLSLLSVRCGSGEAASSSQTPLERIAAARRARAAGFVAMGKAALVVQRDPWRAYRDFDLAQRFDRESPEARFFLAWARLLSVHMRHARWWALLGGTGARGPGRRALSVRDLNPLQFSVVFPTQPRVPPQYRSGAQVQQLIARETLPDLLQSLSDLDRVPGGFVSSLPVRHPLTGAPAVEIDDADVSLSRAVLHLALAQVYVSQVYNADLDLRYLARRLSARSARLPEELLAASPTLFRLQAADRARQAKQEILAAIEHYLAAEALIHGETDDQRDDLFSFSTLPEDARKAEAFHRALLDLSRSLTGLSDTAFALTLDQFLHLGDFFDRPLDLRALETGAGVQAALVSHLLYQSERALANLAGAPVTFSETVDPAAFGFHGGRILEVDDGDLLAIQSALESLNTAVGVLASYDVDVNVVGVSTAAVTRTLDANVLLQQRPDLLRLRDAARLGRVAVTGRRAIERALDASAYVRFSDDLNQQDDLFRLDGRVAQLEAHWRPQLEQLRSLSAVIDPDPARAGDEVRVNFNPLIDTPRDLRGFLPQFFDGMRPRPGTLPDPTLGGTLPDFTEEDWR